MPEKLYLDTYVFMDMLSGNPELAGKAKTYLKSPSVVSAIIAAEISFHIARRDKESVEQILHFIQSLPGLEIVPVSPDIAKLAGLFRAKYRKRIEKKLTYFDCIHLATAIAGKCDKFVTGDRGMRGIVEIEIDVY